MLHKISVLFFFCLLMGCMKVQKKGESQVQTENQLQEANEKLSTGLDFKYDFTQDTPQVVFSFPSDWDTEIEIEKSKNGEKIFNRLVDSKSLKWSDFLPDSNKINYKFFKNKILLDELEILPPLDLSLSTDLNLVEKYFLNNKVRKIHFRHLELRQKAKIFIGDFKGKLTIEKILSEDGSLQTFPNAQRAKSTMNGRSAGGFELDILSGIGLVNVNVLAESGGDGLPGQEPDEKLTGMTGKEGMAATFTPIYPTTISIVPTTFYDCATSPGKGNEGGQGLRGYNGSDGGDGGSVQSIKLSNGSAEFKVVNLLRAGEKGLGGRGASGGRGGQGGSGGDGGQRDLKRFLKLNPDDPSSENKMNLIRLGKPCLAGPQGDIGLRGESGKNGHDGRDGLIFE